MSKIKKAKNELVCKWTHCPSQNEKFASPEELSLHVEQAHLQVCVNDDLFFCLWEGCRVYNKPSYSYSWLRRHTKEKHTKERPNKCLMNGCNMAFNSVEALQRHMMRHFDHTPPPSLSAKAVQSDESTALMVSSHNEDISDVGSTTSSGSNHVKDPLCGHPKKRPHGRDGVDPAHHEHSSLHTHQAPIAFNGVHFHDEVIDCHTMKVIRQTSNMLAYLDTHSTQPSTSFSLTGQVVGHRRGAAGTEAEVLVRWKPRLVSDCWVPVGRFKRHRVVSANELSSWQLSTIADHSLSHHSKKSRKSKRKP